MTETSKRTLREKTFKREVAGVLLIFWVIISCKMWYGILVDNLEAYDSMYGVLTAAVFSFAMGAFGLDHFRKNK